MQRVAFLFACLCAVYARRYHRHYYSSSLPNWPEPSIPLADSVLEADQLDTPPSPYPKVRFPKVSWDLTDQSLETVGDQIMLPNPPKTWIAPPYTKSLEILNEGIATVTSHFAHLPKNKDDKSFRYLVLIHIISSLSKEIAYNGWDSYDTDYLNLINKYVREIYTNPEPAIAKLECTVLKPTLKAIEKVVKIIQHPVVQYLCAAQPSSCDTVIFGIIHTNPREPLIQSEQILLASADSAAVFLQSYAGAFEAISAQNVLKYLESAKEELRPFIAVNSRARFLINGDGRPSC